jgi:penicillin-binding protein 2
MFLRTANDHPLEDKALRGQYPPGSVFKMIVAIAALEEGIITTGNRFFCTGSLKYGRRSFSCWKGKGHGSVNVEDAIIQSCDVFFYRMGDQLGVDKIAKYAKLFGFGSPTGIGINNEKSGLIPTSEWKERVYGIKWIGGENLITAIGQGYDLVTPIQMAYYISALVNGGILYQPRVVDKVTTPEGKLITEIKSEVVRKINIRPQTLEIIKKAMEGVVNDPNGTAYWSARLPNIKVGGKTGTAQVVRASQYRRDSSYEDHAWFVGFAPSDDPEIVVVVLVEHGGHGSSAAAPVAKEIIKEYFDRKAEREQVPPPFIEITPIPIEEEQQPPGERDAG